MHYCLDI